MTNEEYHSHHAYSKSLLDLVAKSPSHLKYVLDGNKRTEPTPAQKIGTAAHELILETPLFYQHYAPGINRADYPHAIDERQMLVEQIEELNAGRLPKLSTSGTKSELIARLIENGCVENSDILEVAKLSDLKTEIQTMNKYRSGLLSTSGNRHELAALLAENGIKVQLWSDIVEEFNAANADKIILSQADWDMLHHMKNAVHGHPVAGKLLAKAGKAEQSFFWNDSETGLDCRCRPDYLTDDNIIIDLKTCADASPDGFARACYSHRYHVQDAFYSDGMAANNRQPKAFIFIAVEKTAPFGVGVYVLNEESKQLGRALYRRDLESIKQCESQDAWPTYTTRIEEISLPKYAFFTE